MHVNSSNRCWCISTSHKIKDLQCRFCRGSFIAATRQLPRLLFDSLHVKPILSQWRKVQTTNGGRETAEKAYSQPILSQSASNKAVRLLERILAASSVAVLPDLPGRSQVHNHENWGNLRMISHTHSRNIYTICYQKHQTNAVYFGFSCNMYDNMHDTKKLDATSKTVKKSKPFIIHAWLD